MAGDTIRHEDDEGIPRSREIKDSELRLSRDTNPLACDIAKRPRISQTEHALLAKRVSGERCCVASQPIRLGGRGGVVVHSQGHSLAVAGATEQDAGIAYVSAYERAW